MYTVHFYTSSLYPIATSNCLATPSKVTLKSKFYKHKANIVKINNPRNHILNPTRLVYTPSNTLLLYCIWKHYPKIVKEPKINSESENNIT